jgi:antitoxin component YwqK of YwqJK toxin-antitoxin module
VLIFQLMYSQASSQYQDTMYYNAKWQLCLKSFASYFRCGKIFADSFFYYAGEVHDYYANGNLQMVGNYSKAGLKDGPFTFYYPTGEIMAKGNFTRGLAYGTWTYYYENGTTKARIYYSGDENSLIILDYFDSTGQALTKEGTGHFEIDVNDFASRQQCKLYGQFTSGNRDGIWKYYKVNQSDHEVLLFKEQYQNGKFWQGTSYESDSFWYFHEPRTITNALFFDKFWATETFERDQLSFAVGENDSTTLIHANTRDTIGALSRVEVEAAFMGGEKTWYKFLERNVHAEAIAKDLPRHKKKFEQTVLVQFVVCVDGTVCEVKTVNDVAPSARNEAERVVKRTSGYWKPAINYGRAVKAFRTVAITMVYEESY